MIFIFSVYAGWHGSGIIPLLGYIFLSIADCPLIIMVFIAVMVSLYLFCIFNFRRSYFDFEDGCYWKGRPHPRNVADPYMKCRDYTPFNHIYALQLLEIERYTRNKGTYFLFELNIVKKDASRINVIGKYVNLARLRKDSEILASRLGVPLWDMTVLRKKQSKKSKLLCLSGILLMLVGGLIFHAYRKDISASWTKVWSELLTGAIVLLTGAFLCFLSKKFYYKSKQQN